MLVEQRLQCPWCFEPISVLLDLSAGGAACIEDCEVCCNPIEIRYETDAGAVTAFCAERAQ